MLAIPLPTSPQAGWVTVGVGGTGARTCAHAAPRRTRCELYSVLVEDRPGQASLAHGPRSTRGPSRSKISRNFRSRTVGRTDPFPMNSLRFEGRHYRQFFYKRFSDLTGSGLPPDSGPGAAFSAKISLFRRGKLRPNFSRKFSVNFGSGLLKERVWASPPLSPAFRSRPRCIFLRETEAAEEQEKLRVSFSNSSAPHLTSRSFHRP